mgnify:CR=1 FL=1
MTATWSEPERECLMAHLIRVALADGENLTAPEAQLLEVQRARLCISPDTMARLRAEIAGGRCPEAPNDPELCERMYLDLVEIAASDGISAEERRMLMRLAPEYGITAEEAGALLDDFDDFDLL